MGNSIGMRREVDGENVNNDDIHALIRRAVNVNTSSVAFAETGDDEESLLALCRVDPLHKTPNREKLRRHVLMKDLFPKIKKPRVNRQTTEFWISPFERLPYREPIIKANGNYGPGQPGVNYFPRFVKRFLNRDLRLEVKLRSSNARPDVLHKHSEVLYLRRSVKYVKVLLMQHSVDQKVRVYIEECHGRRRNTSLSKMRPMYVKFLLMDHIQQSLFISGGEFLLSLSPPDSDYMWSEGADKESPSIVGHYAREIDSNPNIVLEWTAKPWKWYEETMTTQF